MLCEKESLQDSACERLQIWTLVCSWGVWVGITCWTLFAVVFTEGRKKPLHWRDSDVVAIIAKADPDPFGSPCVSVQVLPAPFRRKDRSIALSWLCPLTGAISASTPCSSVPFCGSVTGSGGVECRSCSRCDTSPSCPWGQAQDGLPSNALPRKIHYTGQNKQSGHFIANSNSFQKLSLGEESCVNSPHYSEVSGDRRERFFQQSTGRALRPGGTFVSGNSATANIFHLWKDW